MFGRKTPNTLIVGEFLTAIISVVLFLVIMLALSFLIKRYVKNGTFTKQSGKTLKNMEIIEKLILGNGQALLLVKICDEYMVLGVTNGNITTLAEITPDNIIANQPPTTPVPPTAAANETAAATNNSTPLSFFEIFKKKFTPSATSAEPPTTAAEPPHTTAAAHPPTAATQKSESPTATQKAETEVNDLEKTE